jgi:hypothetical protein
MSIGGEIETYVKFGLILISYAWDFNSTFNSAAKTLLLVNHKQTILESIETSYAMYWGWNKNIYILILGLFSYPFLEVLIGGSILSQTGHAWGLGT